MVKRERGRHLQHHARALWRQVAHLGHRGAPRRRGARGRAPGAGVHQPRYVPRHRHAGGCERSVENAIKQELQAPYRQAPVTHLIQEYRFARAQARARTPHPPPKCLILSMTSNSSMTTSACVSNAWRATAAAPIAPTLDLTADWRNQAHVSHMAH